VCYYDKKLIIAPKPVTAISLHIFLHECAHAHLHDGLRLGRKPEYVIELEAELWALDIMTKHGIPVSEATVSARRYIAQQIVEAEGWGCKHFDPQAIEFAGEYLTEWRAYDYKHFGHFEYPTAEDRKLITTTMQQLTWQTEGAGKIAAVEGAFYIVKQIAIDDENGFAPIYGAYVARDREEAADDGTPLDEGFVSVEDAMSACSQHYANNNDEIANRLRGAT
jgi:hypothetical protein